jgi:hypothetical protein
MSVKPAVRLQLSYQAQQDGRGSRDVTGQEIPVALLNPRPHLMGLKVFHVVGADRDFPQRAGERLERAVQKRGILPPAEIGERLEELLMRTADAMDER